MTLLTNKVASTGEANTSKSNTVLYLKLFGMLIGVVIGIIIANMTPPDGLVQASMVGLGVFVCTVIWWVTDLLPDYIVCLGMTACWVLFGAVNFEVAFGGFVNKNVWLLIGAFGMAACVTQSGLLHRISLALMSLFPLSFKGQTAGLMATGAIINPLIPSGSAKIAVVAPFAANISRTMGFKQKSVGAGGIWSSMYLSLGTLHPMFLSASFLAYSLVGILPKEVQGDITWMKWCIGALPWGLTILILGWIVIQFMYRPEGNARMSSEYLKEERAKLGSITRNEWIAAIVLGITLLLWMTEKTHGISAGVVAVVSMLIMISFGLIDRQSFRAKIPWDSVIFIGCIFAVAAVFKTIQLTDYIGKIITPYLGPMIEGNFVLFIVLLSLMIYVVRFLMASQLAMFTIVTVVLAPVAMKMGIHPWVIGFCSYVAVNVWIFMYQNAQYLVALFAADGGEMVTHNQNIKLCLAYMVISIIGLIISIPLWKLIGFIQ